MRAIGHHIWSQRSLAGGGDERHRAIEARYADPYPVASFHDLVIATAEIAFQNPKFLLFYRGQVEDYRDKEGRSTIMPQIYRELERWDRASEIERRISQLESAREVLLMHMRGHLGGRGATRVANYPEIGWSLLQHYDVCPSPLLDLTQSLRVAASFALPEKGQNQYGFVYVLGFPHVNGSMTFSAEEEIVNIRLLSICPPMAKRPYFQEGFLVGSFPIARGGSLASQDVARRLIARFRLSRDSFWDVQYPRIPDAALFPSGDPFVSVCGQVRLDIGLPAKPTWIE